MVELERQLREWTDAAVDGVEPVTATELVNGRLVASQSRSAASRRSASTIRSRRLLVIGVAAAVVLTVAVGVAVGRNGGRSGSQPVRAGEGPAPATAWTRLVVPDPRWTLDRPVGWRVQSYRNQCKIEESGSLISNQSRPVPTAHDPNGCSAPPWDLTRLPEGFVGVNVAHYYGGPPEPADVHTRSTELPLRFADFTPGGRGASKRIVIDGDRRYMIFVYLGTHVSPSDRRAMERIVGSIRWTRRRVRMIPASGDSGRVIGYIRSDDMGGLPDGLRPGVTVPNPPLDVFDKGGSKLLGHFYQDGVGYMSLATERRTGYGPTNPPPGKVTTTTVGR